MGTQKENDLFNSPGKSPLLFCSAAPMLCPSEGFGFKLRQAAHLAHNHYPETNVAPGDAQSFLHRAPPHLHPKAVRAGYDPLPRHTHHLYKTDDPFAPQPLGPKVSVRFRRAWFRDRLSGCAAGFDRRRSG